MKYRNKQTGVVIDIPSQIALGKKWEVLDTSPSSTSETTPKKTTRKKTK